VSTQAGRDSARAYSAPLCVNASQNCDIRVLHGSIQKYAYVKNDAYVFIHTHITYVCIHTYTHNICMYTQRRTCAKSLPEKSMDRVVQRLKPKP
jgi:hypothetical protein